jgi:hypothetical protein
MRLLRKCFLAATAALVLFVSGTALADVVCRRAGIAGFDAEAARAKTILTRQKTSDINEAEVFITKKDGHLYCHSNIVSEGADFPTKIATEKVRDLELITANLFTQPDEGGFTPDQIAEIRNGHRKYVKFYLDQSLFDSEGKLELDLKGAEKLYVLFDGSPPPKRLVNIHPIRGPPLACEYYPSLYVKITSSTSPTGLFSKLENRPFKSKEIKFASIISDSAVEDAIKSSDAAKVWKKLDITSPDGVRSFFQANKGRVVVLLGHVEENDFVATDATGRVVFRMLLAGAERLAEEAGCDAILLGCSSAAAGTPIGVDKPFNPAEAVQRLSKALGATNYLDFVRTLANEDMGLVFAETAFDRTTKRLQADVYARKAGTTEPVIQKQNLAGSLILAFGIAATGGIGGGASSGGNDDDHSGDGRGGGRDGDGTDRLESGGKNKTQQGPGSTTSQTVVPDYDDKERQNRASSTGKGSSGSHQKTRSDEADKGVWIPWLFVPIALLLLLVLRAVFRKGTA